MNKSLLFWSITCLALTFTYFATQIDKQASTHQFQPLSLTQSHIDRIELEGKQRLVLFRKQGKWRLELPTSEGTKQVLASTNEITNLFRTLKELEHDYLVSQHANKHNQYGVGQLPEQGMVRLFKGDKQQWSLTMGNMADGFGRLHVRLGNSPHVFVVKGAWWSLGLQATNLNKWRNKNVFPPQLRVESVQHIAVSNTQQHISWALQLDTKQNKWQVAQPQQLPTNYQLSEDRVRQLLQSFTQLQTQNFVDDAHAQQQAKQQFAKNALGQIEITLESGKRYTLRFAPAHPVAPKGSKKHPHVIAQLQGGQDDSLYVLNQQQMHDVLPHLTALRDWSLWRLEPKNMQQLSVQNPARDPLVFAKQGKQWTCTQPNQLPENFELDEQRLQDQLLRLCKLQAQGLAPKNQQERLRTQLLQSGTRIELKDTKGNMYAVRFLKAPSPKTTQWVTYYVAKEQDHDGLVYALQGQEDDLWVAGVTALQRAAADTF